MSRIDPSKNGKVVLLRPRDGQLYRIRITVDPNDFQSLALAESLLAKCELSRCDHASEDGVTTWSIIGTEDLVDQALDGVAVTVPIETEFFETDEGCFYLVTNTEWFILQGIAEEVARCWCGESLENFEYEIHQDVLGRMGAPSV